MCCHKNIGHLKSLLIFLAVASSVALALNGAGAKHFDAASIRPAPGCRPPTAPPLSADGRLGLKCITIEMLIRNAFSIYANGSTTNFRGRRTEIRGDHPG